MTSDGPPLDVVVSIASHDGLDALLRCLATLPSACDGLRWEAVVLQNLPCAGDGILEERFPWVKVIRNPHPRGFGANHNAVLAPLLHEHRTRYALVLNDDTEVSPSAIRSLVACADADPRLGAVGPLTYWPDGRVQPVYYSFPRPVRSFFASIIPRMPRARPIVEGEGWLRGSCLLLRLEALGEVGLFDTQFFLFFEDTDLSARFWSAGWRVAACRTATIVHAAHSTVSRPHLADAMQRQLLRSQFLYQRKHFGAPVAAVLGYWDRIALLSRGAFRFVVQRPQGHPMAGDEPGRLITLARFRPVEPLPHENLFTTQ